MQENFIYHVLDIPNYLNIHTQLLDWTLERIPLYKQPYNHLALQDQIAQCPLIHNWFRSVGLEPKICALIVQPGGADQRGTHTDTQPNSLALNFGIKNTAKTHTAFYRVVAGNMVRKTLANGITWNSYEQATLEELARIDLAKPTIINTKVPHAVINPTQEPRISMSFRFHQDPWHLT